MLSKIPRNYLTEKIQDLKNKKFETSKTAFENI